MKLNKYVLSFAATALIFSAGMAQTAPQRKAIVKNYKVQKMALISKQYAKTYQSQRQAALNYAKQHHLPLVITYDNGQKSVLDRMDRFGNLRYIKASNLGAATTIGVPDLYPGGILGLQLEGENMLAAVWDGGKVKVTHELLSGKATQMDDATDYDDHATHVAGTIAGKALTSGIGQLAKGMAYKAELETYDWYSDYSEMMAAGLNGLLVSNHSYGLDLAQLGSQGGNLDLYLGVYGGTSASIDNLAYMAPKYTIVTAAGNDRNNPNINPSDNGYNLLGAEMATSKNDIVVAAVKKVTDYTGPSSVEMSSFSSWGPTNDNRIKPDISADGVNVYSSIAHTQFGGTTPSDNTYAYLSGTSMASPTVSGGILLLQELSSDLNGGSFLNSATIKAIIFETAREAGTTPGPDPKFGWGLLNVSAAAQLMLDDYDANGEAFYDELTLQNSDTYTRQIQAGNVDQLQVTIAWTDPAGTAQDVDDNNVIIVDSVLVNDLDMRITDSQGNVYYPWRLDGMAYYNPAKNDGDNAVDNVEQITIPNPTPGETYTITITHKGSLKFNKQDFSIAASGMQTMGVDAHELQGVAMYPNPATNVVNLSLQKAGEQVSVQVFNMLGQQVLTQQFSGQSSAYHLNIADLNSGVYFVKIATNNKTLTQKLIVK